MRRLLYFVVTAGVVAATAVALASASQTAPRKASVTPLQETANAYLPKGTKPVVNDWNLPGGDEAATLFSQLKQINSTNVSGLKVAWTRSIHPVAQAVGALQQAPLCCPNGLMYQNIRTGAVALSPADGSTVWEYKGVQYDLVQGATTQRIASRGISWSPKYDYLFIGQNDGSIVALKGKTGAPVWTAQTAGAGTFGSATGTSSASFAVYYDDGADGIVLAAPNGGESPFRGHQDAFNAKTGALVWRTWTTPDPTQLPYILTWANPAEASQGGAPVWSVPNVDTENGLVYYGTGNLYPWTGRQPGDNLWGTALMASDWKTGALKWYFQHMKHDIWDLDGPQPPTRMNVPIDGKMMPVVAHGGKNGYMYVLNAKNGGYLPHFGFKTIQTYDPTGLGKIRNGLSNTQVLPNFGAVGCMAVQEFTQAAIQACQAVPGANTAADGTASKHGVGALFTGTGNFAPSDILQIAYGGTAPNPGVPGSYGPGVQGENGTDPCPTCKVINTANGKPIEGTSYAAAHTSAAYFAFGGTAGGPFNYPFKTYSPLTHYMYTCTRLNQHSAKGNVGDPGNPAGTYQSANIGSSHNDPRLFIASLDAVNMTNNTFAWRYATKQSTFGTCNTGNMSTAGNLVFQSFAGRTDLNAGQLAALGIAPGGVFAAFDATTGKLLWQYGNPNSGYAHHPITYSYKGKQYVAIWGSLPAAGTLGSIPSGQRDRMTVFSL